MLQALNLPKKVYFKPGCMPVALRELGDIYRCQRALLVTDPELYRAGIAAPVADRLRKQEIRVAEFFTIGKRVSFGDLRSALPKLSEFQPDVIVGVGGNNAMSAAKALLALYQEPELDLAAAAAGYIRSAGLTQAELDALQANLSKDYTLPTEETPAESPEETPAEKPAGQTPPQNTYTIASGDCLWSIAQKLYGTGTRWPELYEANRTIIHDPNQIQIGQVLTVPAA